MPQIVLTMLTIFCLCNLFSRSPAVQNFGYDRNVILQQNCHICLRITYGCSLWMQFNKKALRLTSKGF